MYSNFAKNTSKLVSGNFIAQIIGIIAIPIITRLYSVESYGFFSIIVAASIFLASFSTFSLHLAILIPKSNYEAKKIFALASKLVIAFCVFISLIIWMFEVEIATYLNIMQSRFLVFSIPVLVLLQGVYQIVTYWGVREKKFGKVSKAKVFEGLVDRFGAIGLALHTFSSSYSLIGARIFSYLFFIIYLVPLLRGAYFKAKCKQDEALSYKDIITTYQGYFKYNTLSIILINGMGQLPLLIFAAYFSPIAAGLYAMANRVVNIPVAALGSAVSKAFTQKIAQDYANNYIDSIGNNTSRLFSILFPLLLIPFSFLTLIGSDLFGVILGEHWFESGRMASLLSFFAMSTLLTQSFGGIFDVFNKQLPRLIFHCVNFVLRIGVILVFVSLRSDPVNVVFSYALVATLMNFCALQLVFNFVGKPYLLVGVLQRNLPLMVAFYLGAMLIRATNESDFIYLTMTSLLSLIWLTIVVYYNHEIRNIICGLMKRKFHTS